MTCACLKNHGVQAGIQSFSSLATSTVIVGGMALGLHLTDYGPNNEQPIHLVIIGVAMAAGCWFPLWVPHVVEDYFRRR